MAGNTKVPLRTMGFPSCSPQFKSSPRLSSQAFYERCGSPKRCRETEPEAEELLAQPLNSSGWYAREVDSVLQFFQPRIAVEHCQEVIGVGRHNKDAFGGCWHSVAGEGQRASLNG